MNRPESIPPPLPPPTAERGPLGHSGWKQGKSQESPEPGQQGDRCGPEDRAPGTGRGGTRWSPFWTLLVLVSLLVLARVAMQSALPVPGCPMRALAGVPCPLCGSTRAFASLAGLDFMGAVRLNPLVSLAACGGIVWSAFTLLRRDQPLAGVKRWPGAPWKWLLVAALLLNWLYLLICLPR